MHPQLKRQLRRAGYPLELDLSVDARLRNLLEQIDAAYVANDEDQTLNERATDLASSEMAALQAALSAERDALESRVAERTDELIAAEQRVLRLLRMSSDWYWECDAQFRLTRISAGFQRITGYRAEDALGKRPLELWPSSPSLGRSQALFQLSSLGKSFTDLPFQVTHCDGRTLDLLGSGEPTYASDGTVNGWSGVIHDVTQERMAQRELEARSLRDPLTELGNRHCFKLEVSALIQAEAPFILTLIDLDRFKSINDAEGHHAGDRFLVEIASRLRSGARHNEAVYRLSGDEFVMVSTGEPADQLPRVLTDTLKHIRPDRALDPISLRAFASAGSARFPDDAQDFDGLLIAADIAMYSAKRQGGHRHFVYSQSLSVEWQQRATLTQALTRALESEQVYCHYQPIFGNGGTEIAGFEALLRWDQCPAPILGPLEIVNYAEQHGLAPLLTRWSLRCIAKDGSALLARCPNAYVALNVTPLQAIDPQLPQQLADFMRAHPEWSGRVVIELTEGPTAIPEHSLNEALTNVVSAGVTLALDDFGSGMSSLQRLLALPLTRLKLDRFLVQGIESDQPRGDFVRAMVALAHSHGLTVTAEGVETHAELQALCDAGADEFQGYFLGRPGSVAAMNAPRLFEK